MKFLIQIYKGLTLPSNLPKAFLKKILSELTIDNPDYISALKHGRSVRFTPKYIRTYTEKNGIYTAPRGYELRLRLLAAEQGLELEFEDRTTILEPEFPYQHITLRDYQAPWVEDMLRHTGGMGISPPGSGKTQMGLEIYAQLGQPCLWLTHTKRLAKQSAKRAEDFLGVKVGMFGMGKEHFEHLTVGLVPTLVRRDLEEYKDKFGLIIVDEAHHVPSRTFTEVISSFSARYIYGLTATPYRDDGLEPLMFQMVGPTLASIEKRVLREAGHLMTPTIIRRGTKLDFPYSSMSKKFGYKALEDALAIDEARNRFICNDVIVEAAGGDNTCIVLVARINHGEQLHNYLKEVFPDTGFVHSEMPQKQSDKILDDFESGSIKILIATYRMLAEGFDYQPSNRLFLTAPVKGRTLIEQACGRVERTHPSKKDVFVFDYVDGRIGVLNRQADIRRDIYDDNDNPVVTLED